MKAAVFHGSEDMRWEDRTEPQAGPGEAILRIGAAGICGTDLKIYRQGHPRFSPDTSRVLGHELAGVIVEIGEGVPSLTPNMRVGVAPNIGCGVCRQCVDGWPNLCPDVRAIGIQHDGAFAQYMRIPAEAIRQGNVVPIPDDVSAEAAALAEPLACCLNGQEALNLGVGDVVVVLGVGPIGVMHVALAKQSGTYVLASGWPQERLRIADRVGADRTINPKDGDDLRAAVDEVSEGWGADAVVVAAPSQSAQQDALTLVGSRGRVNVFGGLPSEEQPIPIDTNVIHYQQAVVTGTTGANIRQYRTAMSLISTGMIDMAPFIGATLPLSAFHEGIQRALSREEMRILLQP